MEADQRPFPLIAELGGLVLDVWALYQRYGDAGVLTDNYQTVTRWMDLSDLRVLDLVSRGWPPPRSPLT